MHIRLGPLVVVVCLLGVAGTARAQVHLDRHHGKSRGRPTRLHFPMSLF